MFLLQYVGGNCESSSSSSSSSIGTTAHCGLWPVEQCPSIFSYLPPTLSIFSLPTPEDLFLLPLSIFSWVFPFFSSLPFLEWRSFWASYPPPGNCESLQLYSVVLCLVIVVQDLRLVINWKHVWNSDKLVLTRAGNIDWHSWTCRLRSSTPSRSKQFISVEDSKWYQTFVFPQNLGTFNTIWFSTGDVRKNFRASSALTAMYAA